MDINKFLETKLSDSNVSYNLRIWFILQKLTGGWKRFSDQTKTQMLFLILFFSIKYTYKTKPSNKNTCIGNSDKASKKWNPFKDKKCTKNGNFIRKKKYAQLHTCETFYAAYCFPWFYLPIVLCPKSVSNKC